MSLGVNVNALILQSRPEQHGKASTGFTFTDTLDITASNTLEKPKDSVTLLCKFFSFLHLASKLPFVSQIFHYAHFSPFKFHPVIT